MRRNENHATSHCLSGMLSPEKFENRYSFKEIFRGFAAETLQFSHQIYKRWKFQKHCILYKLYWLYFGRSAALARSHTNDLDTLKAFESTMEQTALADTVIRQ